MNFDRILWPAVSIVAALGIVLALWAAIASDDGRKCLDYDTTVVTTVVNGKVGTGLVTSCVKYEEAAK